MQVLCIPKTATPEPMGRHWGSDHSAGTVKLFVPTPNETEAAEAVVVERTTEALDADDIAASGEEFHVAVALLQKASPVFASMLEEGAWRESGAERIHLASGFHPDAFGAFLDFLVLLEMSLLQGSQDAVLNVVCSAQTLRQVLPIAHYYQAGRLKDSIMCTVLSEKRLVAMPVLDASDLVFAVEASLPEEAVPDWPASVAHILLRRVLKWSLTSPKPSGKRLALEIKSSLDELEKKLREEKKGEAMETPFASEIVYTNAHRNDHLLMQLSKKTFFKMFTSIQISATVMAKPVSSVCLKHKNASGETHSLQTCVDLSGSTQSMQLAGKEM